MLHPLLRVASVGIGLWAGVAWGIKPGRGKGRQGNVNTERLGAAGWEGSGCPEERREDGKGCVS